MKVTPTQVITRGLTVHCPNCGGKSLFPPGASLRLNKECSQCHLRFEKDEGFFLGAMTLNYGVTLVCFLAPIAALWFGGALGDTMAAWLAISVAIVVPVLLYRASRSWQLMLYYSIFPQHLPANRRELSAVEDENV